MTHNLKLLKMTRLAAVAGLTMLIPWLGEATEPNCSSLGGSYMFRASGFAPAPGAPSPLPIKLLGIMMFDPSGTVSGSQTVNANGFIFRTGFQGTYSLTSDCRGALTVKFPDGTTATVDIAVSAWGETIFALGVDNNGPGASLSFVFSKVR
ncbi:MAG: hypothetical protein ABJC09_06215 [Terriglobia bacterium]